MSEWDDLIRDVREFQFISRREWEKSPFRLVVVVDCGVSVSERRLVTCGGEFSVMPTFDDYCHPWMLAGIISPYVYDWLAFDRFSESDMEYLSSVLEILFEQSVVWSTDYITKESWVYGWFHGFYLSLFALFSYESGLGNLNSRGIEPGSS